MPLSTRAWVAEMLLVDKSAGREWLSQSTWGPGDPAESGERP